MKQRVTRKTSNKKKKGDDTQKPKHSKHNTQTQNVSEFDSFTSEILQNHVSVVQKMVQTALEQKNVIINELQGFNDIVKDEIAKCKSNLKQKNDEIKHLEFKLITLAEVEKFDQTYQLKIAGLEADTETYGL